jgi:alpha-tubulin suppressor-like RCC1 family protein
MGNALPSVDLGSGKNAMAIAGGVYSTCALLNDGHVKCWGRNLYHIVSVSAVDALGDDPAEMGDTLPELDLGAGTTVLVVSVGTHQACALLGDHAVKCWGENIDGETGSMLDPSPPPDQNLPFVDLGTNLTAIGISTGYDFTCALLNDGRIKCWGQSFFGQLGLGARRTTAT